MVLHVKKQRTDSLDLKEVANDIISGCEHIIVRLIWDISRLVYKQFLIIMIVCVDRSRGWSFGLIV